MVVYRYVLEQTQLPAVIGRLLAAYCNRKIKMYSFCASTIFKNLFKIGPLSIYILMGSLVIISNLILLGENNRNLKCSIQ